MRTLQFHKSLIALLLTALMVLQIVAPTALRLNVGGVSPYATSGTFVSVVDRDTTNQYTVSLGDNASTEYAGRLWSDKTVFDDDVTFATFGGGQASFTKGNGEDFLVAFSTLGTSMAVSGETQAPLDVVFVIDISGSMSNSGSLMDNNMTRIANTVTAVNQSIETLMELNENTRISVVTFSTTASVILPLDHYTKMESYSGTYDYLTLSSTSAGNNIDMYVRAVGSSNGQISRTIDVSGGTNIQEGLYTGMNVLATSTSTTANVSGSTIQRIPAVILLSDGSPSYSMTGDWWDPGTNRNGDGDTPYYGNGMKALMTGAYMKNVINAHYGVTGTAYETTFYTVGMGVADLGNYERSFFGSTYTGEQDLAYITLNPGRYWDADNEMAKAIRNAWATYVSQTPGGNGSVSLKVSSSNTGYTARHPRAPLNDIYTANDTDALKTLVDSYHDANNANGVVNAFKDIISSIVINSVSVPTELKGNNPMTDGYITYVDPIGAYMELKDVKGIVYAGTSYTTKTVTTSGNVTTYVFSGHVESPVYGTQEISNIIITVTKDGNGNETVTVKIPASVIPVRVNEVTVNADGTVKTHTNNGAYPARVIYSVGLKSDLVKVSDGGDAYVDTTKISDEYRRANLNADGTIHFYSNLYSGNAVDGKTVGDAYVEFEPSHDNAFYYIQTDMPIYKDEALTRQVKADDGIDDNTTYYYRDEYYHGASVEVRATPRTGAQLNRTDIVEGEDGYLYRAAGSPRLNRILEFEGTKVDNATKTALEFYEPTFVGDTSSAEAHAGKFVVYLGNNGRLSLPAGGNLKVTKTVVTAADLVAPDKAFTFTLDLNGSDVSDLILDYVVTDAAGQQISVGTLSKNSNTFTLKDGQTATIYSLPPDTLYSVTETPVSGFDTQATGAAGVIYTGQTAEAVLTNSYSVESTTWPTGGSLTGVKVLTGRSWNADDSFTFKVMAYNDGPLPENDVVTVTAPDTAGGDTATFSFGSITFTKPGTFRYTVMEAEPADARPGISYSRALYRIVIVVSDNGNGTLSVTDTEIQRLYDDDANPLFHYVNGEITMNAGETAEESEILFTNTYSAESVTRVPVALKNYTDHSGMKPLVSGMFEFKLKALGYALDGGSFVADPSKVPMPSGAVNGESFATNEGQNVTFRPVTFTQDMIPAGADSITFRYEMSEVIPTAKVYGMTYDTTTYVVNVTVSIDPASHVLSVVAVYDSGVTVPRFTNEYRQDPVSVDIDGEKTLVGRDMKTGESFGFLLTPANAFTNNAVRLGNLVIPTASATVTGGKNGVAKGFTFADVTFRQAGTYVFTVTEEQGNAPAVVYDNSTVTVTVVVDDRNNDGKLEATVTYSNGLTYASFRNVYTATFSDEPVSLLGLKSLVGKTLLNGEFYFNVVSYENGTKVGEGLVTHAPDLTPDAEGAYTGAIVFLDQVTYDRAGTYTYYISEQIPENKVLGTTYDTTQYRYTVVVEDVDLVGRLTVTSTKLEKLDGQSWVSANEIHFRNAYEATPATVKVPLIRKLLSGDRAEALKAGEFSFTLTASTADGVTLPSKTTVANDVDGLITFGDVTFTKTGIYTLRITEVVPADADKVPGVTYSTREIVLTFRVTDDRIGTLTATLLAESGGNVIENVYTAAPTDVELKIHKDLRGRDWLTTDFFDFGVVILDPATQDAVASGAITFPMDDSGFDVETKRIDTEGETVTGTVRVNKPGVYQFVVYEIPGAIPGIHYDSQARVVTIVATDDSENAKIKTTVTITKGDATVEDLTFVNIFDPSSIELSGHANLKVTKTLLGREDGKWLSTDAFTFVLAAGDETTKDAVASGDVELPATELVVTDANKAYPHFGNIVFHTEGVYTFTVSEKKGDLSYITYDSAVRTLTVKVESDDANGVLVATVVEEDSDELTFTNTYTTKPTTATVDVFKRLMGRDWLASDKFSFTLVAEGNDALNAVISGDVVMPTENEVEIDGDVAMTSVGRKATFDAITFKKPGVYTFAIREKAGTIANLTYDEHVCYVIVTVTDDGNGNLVAETALQKENANVFINTYVANTVTAAFGGTKKLEGNRDLGEGEFVFVLKAVTEGAPLPSVTEVKNAADGSFRFDSISYNKAGVYVYTITEKNTAAPGITYDDRVYTVTVTVNDNEGLISVKIPVYTLENESVPYAQFVNTYVAGGTEIRLEADKILADRDLVADEFTFQVKDEDGNVILTAKNGADGKVLLGKLTFTKTGTYVYTVSEISGTDAEIVYDTTVYVVTVTVTDDGSGELATEVSLAKKDSTDTVESMVFVNAFVPAAPPTGDDLPFPFWLAILALGGIGAMGVKGRSRKKIHNA